MDLGTDKFGPDQVMKRNIHKLCNYSLQQPVFLKCFVGKGIIPARHITLPAYHFSTAFDVVANWRFDVSS